MPAGDSPDRSETARPDSSADASPIANPYQQDSGGQPPGRASGRQRVDGGPGGKGAPWMRLSGAGMELALITLAFGAAGRWLDGYFSNERAILSGLAGLAGFTFGMIRFVRTATSITAMQDRQYKPGDQRSEEEQENE